MTHPKSPYRVVGTGHKLIEGSEKVTGRARYAGDVTLPGMLYARPILSPYAHAKIVAIDSAAALQRAGVVAVLTAGDLRTSERLITSRNSAVLAKDVVLFCGQPVAVVVAESEAAARDGADAVQIDYEPCPAIVDLLEALADDAPVIWPHGVPQEGADLTATHAATGEGEVLQQRAHSNLYKEHRFERGDVEQGLKEAAVVVEQHYRMAAVHQGYLEPHAVVAEPDPVRGGVTLYTSTQGQFLVRDEVARLLSLPKRQVRVVPMTIGGAFGAKYGILEPLAGAVALAVGRPVRMVLTRSEDFLTTTPSPGCVIELKTAARDDGTLCALQARVLLDNGVFPFTLSAIVAMLLGGYYVCANVQIDCYEILTNKQQVGAYRAPGAPQATFAIEANMDDMARALGMDALEFRLKNAVEAGDPTGLGDLWPPIGLKQCLERLREHPAWQARQTQAHEGVGIAVGGWPCAISPASAICRVDTDGTVRVSVGSVDISGVNSTFTLVAAEMLGVSPDQVEILQGDTQSGPFAGASGGSQTTYSVAGAISLAAQRVREQLLALAEQHFEASIDDLEINAGRVQVKGVPSRAIPIGQLVGIAESKAGGPGPIIGEGRVAVQQNAPGFVVHLVKVRVDPETGQVTPVDYVAVQDVGFALNPLLVEGQIHGGVVQGLGWGLHEGMVYDSYGQLLTATFMDYDLPRADDVPPIEIIMVENPSPLGPFGARGVGEPPITAGAAALANAVKDATGIRVTELPIRAEAIWRAGQRNGSAPM